MRRALVAVLLLSACPEKEKKPEVHGAAPVPAAVVDAGTAPAVEDAGVVITKNVVPEPQPEAPAEVEFSGEIDVGKLKPARVVFLVTKGPCEATSEELEVLEQQDMSPGKMFTEMFFPQGTVANLCAIALDAKGQLVGFAAHAKNPVTFQGEGEVEIKDVLLKVQSVKARAAPKGL